MKIKRNYILWSVLLMFAVFMLTACGKTYTVTFDSNGGTSISEQKVKSEKLVDRPTNPTKPGYTFEGWYLDNDPYDFDTKVTEDITLIARWAETDSYTVTFNSDGGSSVSSQTINVGGKATEPTTPTKSGYTFEGWYNGTVLWDFSDVIDDNITLKASWKIVSTDTDNDPGNNTGTNPGNNSTPQSTVKKWTVTFNANGGSVANSKVTVNDGAKVSSQTPSRANYTFNGWYNGETAWDFNKNVTSNITLTAQWNPIISYRAVITPIEGSMPAKSLIKIIKSTAGVDSTLPGNEVGDVKCTTGGTFSYTASIGYATGVTGTINSCSSFYITYGGSLIENITK